MTIDVDPNLQDGFSIVPDFNNLYSAYELKEIIGRGIASTVRRCVEKATGKFFAAKVVDVSTEKQVDQEAKRLREEILSEISILKTLNGHPSIISLHDHFVTPTFIFAVFELAKGELFDQLNKSVTFSEKKTRPIMRQLFDGVKFLHQNSIVHRDLKLENILCIDDKRIVISDFGFAKKIEAGQKLKELFGTPGYLAPETLRCQMYEDAEGYGLEVDDWALGVIMFTMLAGHAPFYHRQQLRMMRLIQEGKYEFNGPQWENISEEAKDLIRKILVVDVSKRFSFHSSVQLISSLILGSSDALNHPWMTYGMVSGGAAIAAEYRRSSKELRHLFAISQTAIRFLVRLVNIKSLKYAIDRSELRKRPYRRREIRHEAESASFAIYGHWVNRGFHYSRDMLFANKPRPKYIKLNENKSNGSN